MTEALSRIHPAGWVVVTCFTSSKKKDEIYEVFLTPNPPMKRNYDWRYAIILFFNLKNIKQTQEKQKKLILLAYIIYMLKNFDKFFVHYLCHFHLASFPLVSFVLVYFIL